MKLNLNRIKTYANPYVQPAISLDYPSQSSILPAPPPPSKFYKVLWGLKIVRSASPGRTHRSCRRRRGAGRFPEFVMKRRSDAGASQRSSGAASAVTESPIRECPEPRRGAQPRRGRGQSLPQPGKATNGGEGAEVSGGSAGQSQRRTRKIERSEAVIGWPAARGLSFFPEPPSVFVGVWSAEGVRFPPGMRLCEAWKLLPVAPKSRLCGNLPLSERIYSVLQMVCVKHRQVFWTERPKNVSFCRSPIDIDDIEYRDICHKHKPTFQVCKMFSAFIRGR